MAEIAPLVNADSLACQPLKKVKKPLASDKIKHKHASLTSTVRSDFIFKEDSSNWFTVTNSDHQHQLPVLLTSSLAILSSDKSQINLSHGARRCLDTPNAGGTSEWSEAISFELLRSVYGASLLRTEMEIEYRCGSKITDFAVMINGIHLGVSVTRAMSWGQSVFDLAEAERLLSKKLQGVNASTKGVIKAHRWSRQILHILCDHPDNQALLVQAYDQLDSATKANTIVLITNTTGHSRFIYRNDKKKSIE